MKFAMLYSCGKDSALALHRMITAGHTPVCLIVTYNRTADRSWFHGVTNDLLDAVEDSMRIPVIRCICTGDTYDSEVERCLIAAHKSGAEAAVFGDIDMEAHLAWNQERCNRAGLACVNPLWHEPREILVHEVIDAGFKAIIKCVDLAHLDESFLGETLDRGWARRITATGADICGEYGEYHTFVYDGPIYKYPLPIRLGEKINLGNHAVIDIRSTLKAPS
ncbi:MAG: diphthine--ammonia ligase [Oscillospiraceae bacterium]|nr:diphthine--ammonia ligase [Oscillospiraceae bacterium]